MKLVFDARSAERPPHSYRRVLSLVYEAARGAGWNTELWIENKLHSDMEHYSDSTVLIPRENEKIDADYLWSPQPDVITDRLPVIATIHDINPLLQDGRGAFSRWRRIKRFRRRMKDVFSNAWKIATDTQDSCARIAKEFPGYQSSMGVVPLYVDPELKQISGSKSQEKIEELSIKKNFLLFVGSFRKHKNWEGLMQAYARLPEGLRNEHHLVCAGPVHRDMKKAQKLIENLGIKDQVKILGETEERYMSALYSEAALFVFPTFMEGFGLPPLEAMACATPVIASSVTSVPEVLGDAALYIDPYENETITNAIVEVLESQSLQQELIDKGLKRVSQFSPSNTAEAMKRLIEQS